MIFQIFHKATRGFALEGVLTALELSRFRYFYFLWNVCMYVTQSVVLPMPSFVIYHGLKFQVRCSTPIVISEYTHNYGIYINLPYDVETYIICTNVSNITSITVWYNINLHTLKHLAFTMIIISLYIIALIQENIRLL